MTIPTKTPQKPSPETIEDIVTRGDLSKLNAEQRTEFYTKLCNRHGLDPLTQPFDWLMLNGRLVLYANRRCADQLRKINKISINIVSQEYVDNLFSVHVKATDAERREDEDLGVVYMAYPARIKNRDGGWVPHPKAGQPLEGEDRANTILKGITKAKRRVTLSISGLGFLDETEVEDIPDTAKQLPPPGATAEVKVVDTITVVNPGSGYVAPPSKAAEALIGIAAGTNGGEVLAPQDGGPDGRGERSPEGTTEMTGQAWRRFGEQMVKLARNGQSFTPEQQAQMSQMKVERPAMWQKMADAIAEAQRTKGTKETKEPEAPPQPKPDDDPDAYRVWFINEMSTFEKKKDLKDFYDIQRPLWEKCFPPDIEDWEALYSERSAELT